MRCLLSLKLKFKHKLKSVPTRNRVLVRCFLMAELAPESLSCLVELARLSLALLLPALSKRVASFCVKIWCQSNNGSLNSWSLLMSAVKLWNYALTLKIKFQSTLKASQKRQSFWSPPMLWYLERAQGRQIPRKYLKWSKIQTGVSWFLTRCKSCPPKCSVLSLKRVKHIAS